jgi:hypothetical protein
MLTTRRSPERKLYRVGPNCETWPNTLTENPYQIPKVGPQFGPTLYNFRSGRALAAASESKMLGVVLCSGRTPPTSAVRRPARPYKSAIQN